MFIFYFFNFTIESPCSVADRRETLPRDQYLAEFYDASPKIRGPLPKKFGAKKHAKFGAILHDFRL